VVTLQFIANEVYEILSRFAET